MSTSGIVALVAIALVAVASAFIGSLGVRVARSTSDFLVASRTVGPVANASAISGEYLSAASFLGVAGMILRDGADALWFPIAFTTGYLALVLFVAAPLRRSGAYTVPDFAVARLNSDGLRRMCTAFVLVIGWLYLLPQLQGAGLALTTLTALPAWSGIAGAGLVVVLTVVGGGMRSITFVQAFQFWLKLTALLVPAVFVLGLFLSDSRSLERDTAPDFRAATTVDVRTDAVLQTSETVNLVVDGTVDRVRVDGPVTWAPGRHEVAAGTQLTFPAGSPVPTVAGAPTTDREWLQPGTGDADYQMLAIYSVLIAGALGTMGLPHVLVRFYTNPDGRAARRTTLIVLSLLGAFYLLPTIYGALARVYTPDLLLTGRTDSAVLLLPERLVGGTGGQLLTALVTAGAFAAFLSTSSGLTVSVAGVLSQDVLRGSVRDFRVAAGLAVVVPFVLSLGATSLNIADVVGLAFAVAASSFCPLLLLGIWWRGLSDVGATAGLLTGGGLATAAVTATIAGVDRDGWAGALLAQPAAWTVPVAFAVMVGVSRATPGRTAPGVARTMVRLHAPESVGLR